MVGAGEQQQQCVSPELQQLPAVGVGDVEHAAEHGAEGLDQLLGADPTALGQPLRKRREPGDVGENHRPVDDPPRTLGLVDDPVERDPWDTSVEPFSHCFARHDALHADLVGSTDSAQYGRADLLACLAGSTVRWRGPEARQARRATDTLRSQSNSAPCVRHSVLACIAASCRSFPGGGRPTRTPGRGLARVTTPARHRRHVGQPGRCIVRSGRPPPASPTTTAPDTRSIRWTNVSVSPATRSKPKTPRAAVRPRRDARLAQAQRAVEAGDYITGDELRSCPVQRRLRRADRTALDDDPIVLADLADAPLDPDRCR